MDIDRVRGLSDSELAGELSAARRNLYDLRFQLATRQLHDYGQIPQTRRTIARILTVMTERELAETGTSVLGRRPAERVRRRVLSRGRGR